jgi:hypothetical protein
VDSEDGLARAFAACYGGKRQYTIPEPKAYWRGTIVRPTKEMAEEHAKRQFEQEMRDFKFWATRLVEDVSEIDNDGLPFGFRTCDNYEYESPYDEDDEDEEPLDQGTQDYMRDSHMDCANCKGLKTLLPEGLTWEHLFKVGLDTYRFSDVYGRPRYVEVKGRVPDDAPKPDPDKPLLIAKTHGGSHCRGFGFDTDLFGSFGTFVFCFQGEEHPIPQAILDTVSGWEAGEEAKDNKRKAEAELRHAARQKQQRKLLADLMDRVNP